MHILLYIILIDAKDNMMKKDITFALWNLKID